MDSLWQDFHYAARGLRRNPGFTAVILLTLALGIGANTAIFSLINAALLRPLPFPEPDRLVQVLKEWKPPWKQGLEVSGSLDDSEFRALVQGSQLPLQLMAYAWHEANLSGGTEPERVTCGSVSASFLPVLGVRPALGRNFLPEEDRSGGPPALILSEGLWKSRFGGDPQIIDKVVRLDEKGYTVVGVLPARCQLPDRFQVLLPIPFSVEMLQRKHSGISPQVVGRLHPGVTREEARLTLDRVYQATRDAKTPGRILVAGFQEEMVRGIRKELLLFLGAVSCVLLIACGNAANLLLSRASAREKEMSIRLAVGASRWRIIRQLLTESVLLALLASLLGLLLAFWMRHLLQAFISTLPTVQGIPIDWRVLGFTLLIAALTGVAFGLAPALTTARPALADALKESARSVTAGARQHRVRNLLVIGEVALSVILLLGAVLLLKSFLRLRGVDPGFRPDRILSFTIDLSRPKYPDMPSQAAYFEQVIERLSSLPGVEAVGADGMLPFSYVGMSSTLEVDGHPVARDQWSVVSVAVVNSDYFRALGIPLLRGRVLSNADRAGAPLVAIVNERFVGEHFPNEEPIGKRIKTLGDEWRTIVGVVGNVHVGSLDSPPKPMVYASYLESGFGTMSLAVRAKGDPMKLAKAVRACVQSVDPHQPVCSIFTMEQRISESLAPRRWHVLLLASFAGLAVVLASVGIYGVISYLVTERTHEIGVRMVLGASRQAVLLLVLKRGLILALAGIGVGVAGGIALTRIVASELYGVTATDPSTFVLVSLVLTAVAALACSVPARRATLVDPAVALRHE